MSCPVRYDNELKRDVAIKVLADVELADESARRRFRTEALTLSRSEHPHIAVVHEFNADGAVNYIVMGRCRAKRSAIDCGRAGWM